MVLDWCIRIARGGSDLGYGNQTENNPISVSGIWCLTVHRIRNICCSQELMCFMECMKEAKFFSSGNTDLAEGFNTHTGNTIEPGFWMPILRKQIPYKQIL